MSMIGGSDFDTELAAITPWQDRAAPITTAEYAERMERARAMTEAAGADALLVNVGDSLRYFTGIPWMPTERLVAMLLPVKGAPIMVCPNFELGSLKADLLVETDFALWEEHESPQDLIAKTLGAGKTLAVDPVFPFQWGEKLRAAGLKLVDGAPAIDGCRQVKSKAELALLQQAKNMTLEVHRRTARILHAGIKASEIKRFIDAAHRKMGAPAGYSFCIAQFGHATAFPHGLPGDPELQDGQLVLIDTGCRIEGYHSDITRTYAFGDVAQEIRDIWEVEKAAQAAAFDAAKPGVTCEEVDAAARRVIDAAGLGPDYKLPGLPHRTGHGVGLSIHEPAYLVRGDKTVLKPGMCFSNEPMLVVPDQFGVRLEDHFFVTENGAQWFTQPQVSIDAPFPA